MDSLEHKLKELTKSWTNEYVKALVRKIVHRNKITDKFKNSKIEDIHKLLEILFEDESNEIHEHYMNKNELLQTLGPLQMFSNCILYFGCRLTFDKKYAHFLDSKNLPFITKYEALSFFYDHVKRSEIPSLRLSDLMTKSILRELARNLEENEKSHEIIPGKLFEENINQFAGVCGDGFPKNLEVVKVHLVTRLFDSKYDIDLMLQVVSVIHQETLGFSVSQKDTYYSYVYRDLSFWKRNIRKFFEKNDWFHDKYPVVQGLYETREGSDTSKFFIAKELENAMDIALKKRYSKPFPKGLISIETEEERKLGILKTVDWETFEKIMKILKLSIDDIKILDVPVLEINTGYQCPILTPYGTFCKLALNSFEMLFDEITNGMNLFRRGGLKKEHFQKIIEWFAKLTENDQIFSAYRNKRFLIETWKLEEIIDRAYVELEPFMTDPIQKLPKAPIQKSDALKELLKWSEDCEEIHDKFIYMQDSILAPNCFPCNILFAYRNSVFDYMVVHNRKIGKFCASQGYFVNLTVYTHSPESEMTTVRISHEEMLEMEEESFMKILPTIPLHFEMTCEQLSDKIADNVSKSGPICYDIKVEDARKNLELLDKFSAFIDITLKENVLYVKRKVIPSKCEKSNHDFLYDKKLLNILMSQEEPFSKENLEAQRERLEEMRYETDNEEEVKSITNILKNLEIHNFKPPV